MATWAATVTRVNTNSWKASFGNGTYAGTFSSLREAEAAIERSISPGGAPLPWRQQVERFDVVELWYVLQNPDGSFPSESAVAPLAAAKAAKEAKIAADVAAANRVRALTGKGAAPQAEAAVAAAPVASKKKRASAQYGIIRAGGVPLTRR